MKCRNGCRGSRPAAMHSKFYLFSKVGLASKVTMVSSANLTFGGVFKGWNDLFTVVGNNVLYNGFRTSSPRCGQAGRPRCRTGS
ncbi:MAG: hypothetical protein WKF73_03370 [Nocardioidaceae bacterium]